MEGYSEHAREMIYERDKEESLKGRRREEYERKGESG